MCCVILTACNVLDEAVLRFGASHCVTPWPHAPIRVTTEVCRFLQVAIWKTLRIQIMIMWGVGIPALTWFTCSSHVNLATVFFPIFKTRNTMDLLQQIIQHKFYIVQTAPGRRPTEVRSPVYHTFRCKRDYCWAIETDDLWHLLCKKRVPLFAVNYNWRRSLRWYNKLKYI